MTIKSQKQKEVTVKMKQFKDNIRKAIVSETFQMPLFTFNKEFSFQNFRYENYPKQRIDLNLNVVASIARLLQIVEISLNLSQRGQYITKRNLYYKLIHYYKIYSMVDSDIEILSFNLQITREDMHIVSSSRCLLFGNVELYLDGNILKCQPLIISNVPVYRHILKPVTACKNLIILQKESALYQVHQLLLKNVAEGNKKTPLWLEQTIFISSKGYPDNTSRGVIDSLSQVIQNIYYLGDQDIYGVDILLTYSIGYNNFKTILDKLQWIQFDQLAQTEQIQKEYQTLSKEDKIKYSQIICRKYFKDLYIYEPASHKEQKMKRKLLLWMQKLKQIFERDKKMELESFFKFLPENWLQMVVEHKVSL